MYANVMRLTKEPIVNSVQVKGEARSVMNNRVAINYGADKTTFLDIAVWGRLAELMGERLKKGDEFYAEGELMNGVYLCKKEGQDDTKIQTVYLQVASIKFTHGKGKGTEGETENMGEENEPT